MHLKIAEKASRGCIYLHIFLDILSKVSEQIANENDAKLPSDYLIVV